MSDGYEKLMKAIEFERARSRMSTPLARKLADLLSEEKPQLKCRDGTRLAVEEDDLRAVTEILGPEASESVSMPIYLRPSASMGHGFYELLGVEKGSEAGRKLDAIVFGLIEEEPRCYLYGYEVQRLKRRVPSLVYIFY